MTTTTHVPTGRRMLNFALGSAAGDLTAEKLNVGYGKTGLLFAGLIAVITAVHYVLKARIDASRARHTSNAVLAFWLDCILTRPLGASIGDFLSQPAGDGGLGLGTVVTSVGGCLECLSLAVGYRALRLFAALLYAGALATTPPITVLQPTLR